MIGATVLGGMLMGLGFAVGPWVYNFLLYGGQPPYRRIETLKDPVKIVTYNEKGLLLADGRRVLPPRMNALPKASTVIDALAARGIELNKDGEMYGLLRVPRCCGNDRCIEHIARVNVSHLLQFTGEGEPKHPERCYDDALPTMPIPASFKRGDFRKGDYYRLVSWAKLYMADEAPIPAPQTPTANAPPTPAARDRSRP